MTNWPEIESKYFMHTFDRVPVTLVKGKGARVWDDNGREYLDFVGGLAVNVLGHCHPVVVKALNAQAKTLIQTSNLFYTTPQLQLAELLAKNSCLQKAFFCNSGAEANEGAVKLARRYGQLHRNGAFEVITAFNSFHGRTLAMVAATGQAKMQKPYLPMPCGFVNVPFNDIEALKSTTAERTCAVMLELVQGEGGINMAPEGYFKQVRDWCNEKGLLLILDEIQTGMGRLGTLFGYQQFGIEPDVITLAKGLAGGIPIGAIMAKAEASVFVPGEHGSTFGGNPLACAVAVAALNYIVDRDIPGNAKKVGQYMVDKLEDLKRKYGFITDVRGRGLLLAIQFGSDISSQVMKGCLEAGLLVNNVKPNALRFIPPLIIGRAEVDEAIGILDKVLSSLKK